MKKHFVHFESPGTFVSEKAIEMSKDILERHNTKALFNKLALLNCN